MVVKQDSFEDFLSGAEADFVGRLLANLPHEPWAQTLLRDIKAAGGLNRANKAKLFELRFGHALRHAGIVPRYEVPGEGESTIDFAFSSAKREWLVELMRLEETAAARQATKTQTDEEGMSFISHILSTMAKDPRQSEEGETLKAVNASARNAKAMVGLTSFRNLTVPISFCSLICGYSCTEATSTTTCMLVSVVRFSGPTSSGDFGTVS